MKTKIPKFKTAATITIHGADTMTLKGRRDIAKWMREQAAYLVRYGEDYDRHVQSRYLYNDGSVGNRLLTFLGKK